MKKHLTWSKNTVTIRDHVSKHGAIKSYERDLNFDDIQVKRGGLLEDCVNAIPLGSQGCHTNLFLRALDVITRQSDIRATLSRPAEDLDISDIERLHMGIDLACASISKSKDAPRRVRQYFRRCPSPLLNGNLIRDLPIYHKNRKRIAKKTRLISDLFDSGASLGHQEPISHISYSDLSDLEEKAKEHLIERNRRVVDSAVEVLDRYEAYAEHIKRLKLLSLPPDITYLIENRYACSNRVAWKNMEPTMLLAGYLQFYEKNQLHTYQGYSSTNKAAYRPLSQTLGSGRLPLPACFCGMFRVYEALTADRFLPRPVILACELILMIDSKWNAQAINTLTKSRVKPVERHGISQGYKVTGIKGKTDQLLTQTSPDNEVTFTRSAHPLSVRALRLLLCNNGNISKYWGQETEYLMVAYANREMTNLHQLSRQHLPDDLQAGFSWYSRAPVMDWFTDEFQLPIGLCFSQIRHQQANLEYLTNKDIFRVQALLDHANIETSRAYLDTHILRRIAEANMSQFMKRLSASLAFSCGAQLADKIGANYADVDKKLLFPVSSDSEIGKSVCDNWLISNQPNSENIKFEIGHEEVVFCAWQRRYYIDHHLELHTSNPSRFVHYELPRIIFCLALYKLIEESEFKDILHSAEKTFHEKR